MIISASRRTDIPALYWDWFLNRLQAGFALTRNPMNANQIKRVDLSPEAADGFVFWTKNALPVLDRLSPLAGRAHYFQFTVTPYGRDIEPGLPDADARLDALLRLADRIGPERVHWRYDPVLLTDRYTSAFHEDAFAGMADRIAGRARGCTFSFLDTYKKIERPLAALGASRPDEAARRRLARSFAAAAEGAGLPLYSCCEGSECAQYGIRQGSCIDAALLGELAGRPIAAKRDPSQREGCRCARASDIGAYDTCTHLCRYCYANRSPKAVAERVKRHDPQSPFLVD